MDESAKQKLREAIYDEHGGAISSQWTVDRLMEKLEPVIDRLLADAQTAAIARAAEHQQHHIFSVHSGAVVQSSCSCGEQFPTQGSCEAWKQHILSLSPQSVEDWRKLVEVEAKSVAYKDAHKEFGCNCLTRPVAERCYVGVVITDLEREADALREKVK